MPRESMSHGGSHFAPGRGVGRGRPVTAALAVPEDDGVALEMVVTLADALAVAVAEALAEALDDVEAIALSGDAVPDSTAAMTSGCFSPRVRAYQTSSTSAHAANRMKSPCALDDASRFGRSAVARPSTAPPFPRAEAGS